MDKIMQTWFPRALAVIGWPATPLFVAKAVTVPTIFDAALLGSAAAFSVAAPFLMRMAATTDTRGAPPARAGAREESMPRRDDWTRGTVLDGPSPEISRERAEVGQFTDDALDARIEKILATRAEWLRSGRFDEDEGAARRAPTGAEAISAQPGAMTRRLAPARSDDIDFSI
jgi:hypothetical protein